MVISHLTNEETKERGVTGCRPESSRQQIKDGEARPPVPGDPVRALRNGPRMAPLQGGWRIEDGVTEPLAWGWGGTHSRCSLNCSRGCYEPKVSMNQSLNKPEISVLFS